MAILFDALPIVRDIIKPLLVAGRRLQMEEDLQQAYGIGVYVDHEARTIGFSEEAFKRLKAAHKAEGFEVAWASNNPTKLARKREEGKEVFRYDGYTIVWGVHVVVTWKKDEAPT